MCYSHNYQVVIKGKSLTRESKELVSCNMFVFGFRYTLRIASTLQYKCTYLGVMREVQLKLPT